MNLKELKREVPYLWRVQSFSKNKASCSCVAYVDARQVMDLLDEVVGPENWQTEFKELKGVIYCGIGIINEGGNSWTWKWDCGTAGDIEKEKSESSDAFKRAAVKWGIGRFLYDLDIVYLDTNEAKTTSNYPYPVGNGKRIWNVTTYINEVILKNKS